MELFLIPNNPSQLETAPSLSQKMPLLSYESFLLFLGHKETFSLLQKFSCFSLTTFLRSIRGNCTLPFEILSYFYFYLLFTSFRQLPFILLFAFVMDFLIFTKESWLAFPIVPSWHGSLNSTSLLCIINKIVEIKLNTCLKTIISKIYPMRNN